MYIKKYINHNNFSKHFTKGTILTFLFSLVIFNILGINYENIVAKDISKGVIRLHVRANSDTSIDQNLKLKVRDAVLNHLECTDINFDSQQKSDEYLSNNLEEINQVAQQTIYDNGFSYKVVTSLENEDFPEKTYGNVTLPKGNYRSLIIKIGNSKGHNWWCVLYPPLCFVDVSTTTMPEDSQDKLQDSITMSEFDYITSNNLGNTENTSPEERSSEEPKIQFRFRFLTFLNDLF